MAYLPNLSKTREYSRSALVNVLRLSILLPMLYTLLSAPAIPAPFFVADALVGSGLSPELFSKTAAVIILLLMLAWVLGGGILAFKAMERIRDRRYRPNNGTTLGLSLFVAVWGLTATPFIGWILGGLVNLTLSLF